MFPTMKNPFKLRVSFFAGNLLHKATLFHSPKISSFAFLPEAERMAAIV